MPTISPAETSATPSSCSLRGAKPLLRTSDVLAFLPFGKSKLYEEIHAGRFVAPAKASSRMALYRREDVEAYLGKLIAGAVATQQATGQCDPNKDNNKGKKNEFK